MFKDFTYMSFNTKTDRRTYRISDTDYPPIDIEENIPFSIAEKVLVAMTYRKLAAELPPEYATSARNTFIAKNLAVFTLWHNKTSKHSIRDIVRWQNSYYPKYIGNWNDYDLVAAKRDECIGKIQIIE